MGAGGQAVGGLAAGRVHLDPAAAAEHNAQLAHPGLFAPATAEAMATAADVPRLSWFQAFRWTPEQSPVGPLTILISTADQHATDQQRAAAAAIALNSRRRDRAEPALNRRRPGTGS